MDQNSADLVAWVTKLRNQIAVNELTAAESRYATARVQYGQLEAAAESFPQLDRRINALADEAPPLELVGFHRLEKGLFGDRTTRGLNAYAKQLLADVKRLRKRLSRMELSPMEIVAAGRRLLNEVATSKVYGSEERFAHIDLVDIAANVEAARAAFAVVTPVLAERDPALNGKVGTAFESAFEALRSFGLAAHEPGHAWPRAAGAGFTPYDELTNAEISELSRPLQSLAALFSRVPEALRPNN